MLYKKLNLETGVREYQVDDYPTGATAYVTSANHNYEPLTDSYYDNINWSTVQTELIQAAGRWCEDFASDILYPINRISRRIKKLRTGTVDGIYSEILFFYRSGVHAYTPMYIRSKDGQDCLDGMSDIRAIYQIGLKIVPDEGTSKKPDYRVEVALVRLD